MLFSCLIANLTAQSISSSYFDVVLLMKNLPHLPSIKSPKLYNLTAQSIMSLKVYPIKISEFNYMNSLFLLYRMEKKQFYSIPLIDDSGVIRYTLQCKKLMKYLFHLYENYKLNYETEIQNKMHKVIKFLRKKLGKKYSSFWIYLKYKLKKICRTKNEKEKIKRNKLIEMQSVGETLEFLKDCKIKVFNI
jgi:hypothetical protein